MYAIRSYYGNLLLARGKGYAVGRIGRGLRSGNDFTEQIRCPGKKFQPLMNAFGAFFRGNHHPVGGILYFTDLAFYFAGGSCDIIRQPPYFRRYHAEPFSGFSGA